MIKPSILVPRTPRTTAQQTKKMGSIGVIFLRADSTNIRAIASVVGTAPASWGNEILRDERSV